MIKRLLISFVSLFLITYMFFSSGASFIHPAWPAYFLAFLVSIWGEVSFRLVKKGSRNIVFWGSTILLLVIYTNIIGGSYDALFTPILFLFYCQCYAATAVIFKFKA